MPASRLGLAFAVSAILLLGLIGTAVQGAGRRKCRCRESVCICHEEHKSRGWKVLESRRFRIHFVGKAEKARPLVPLCERTCNALRDRWLETDADTDWTPKCDVYLYPSGKEFERLTHVPAEGWGFTDLAVGDGRVWTRSLHLRSDDESRQNSVLVHELTHVVLAERFTEKPIPRWADEGIAVLSEPAERQCQQVGWLVEECSQRRLFGLKELTRQPNIPQDQRQCDLFYAQSGALVDYLMTEHGFTTSRLLSFVKDCEKRGWDATLKKWFPGTSAKEFETSWKAWLAVRHAALMAEQEKVGPVSQAAAVVQEPSASGT